MYNKILPSSEWKTSNQQNKEVANPSLFPQPINTIPLKRSSLRSFQAINQDQPTNTVLNQPQIQQRLSPPYDRDQFPHIQGKKSHNIDDKSNKILKPELQPIKSIPYPLFFLPALLPTPPTLSSLRWLLGHGAAIRTITNNMYPMFPYAIHHSCIFMHLCPELGHIRLRPPVRLSPEFINPDLTSDAVSPVLSEENLAGIVAFADWVDPYSNSMQGDSSQLPGYLFPVPRHTQISSLQALSALPLSADRAIVQEAMGINPDNSIPTSTLLDQVYTTTNAHHVTHQTSQTPLMQLQIPSNTPVANLTPFLPIASALTTCHNVGIDSDPLSEQHSLAPYSTALPNGFLPYGLGLRGNNAPGGGSIAPGQTLFPSSDDPTQRVLCNLFQRPIPKALNHNTSIYVEISECRNLPNAGSGQHCNPYVTVSLDDNTLEYRLLCIDLDRMDHEMYNPRSHRPKNSSSILSSSNGIASIISKSPDKASIIISSKLSQHMYSGSQIPITTGLHIGVKKALLTKRTSTKYNTNIPIFTDEKFHFALTGFTPQGYIIVNVYSRHIRTNFITKVTSELLGTVLIPLSDLLKFGMIAGWFRLTNGRFIPLYDDDDHHHTGNNHNSLDNTASSSTTGGESVQYTQGSIHLRIVLCVEPDMQHAKSAYLSNSIGSYVDHTLFSPASSISAVSSLNDGKTPMRNSSISESSTSQTLSGMRQTVGNISNWVVSLLEYNNNNAKIWGGQGCIPKAFLQGITSVDRSLLDPLLTGPIVLHYLKDAAKGYSRICLHYMGCVMILGRALRRLEKTSGLTFLPPRKKNVKTVPQNKSSSNQQTKTDMNNLPSSTIRPPSSTVESTDSRARSANSTNSHKSSSASPLDTSEKYGIPDSLIGYTGTISVGLFKRYYRSHGWKVAVQQYLHRLYAYPEEYDNQTVSNYSITTPVANKGYFPSQSSKGHTNSVVPLSTSVVSPSTPIGSLSIATSTGDSTGSANPNVSVSSPSVNNTYDGASESPGSPSPDEALSPDIPVVPTPDSASVPSLTSLFAMPLATHTFPFPIGAGPAFDYISRSGSQSNRLRISIQLDNPLRFTLPPANRLLRRAGPASEHHAGGGTFILALPESSADKSGSKSADELCFNIIMVSVTRLFEHLAYMILSRLPSALSPPRLESNATNASLFLYALVKPLPITRIDPPEPPKIDNSDPSLSSDSYSYQVFRPPLSRWATTSSEDICLFPPSIAPLNPFMSAGTSYLPPAHIVTAPSCWSSPLSSQHASQWNQTTVQMAKTSHVINPIQSMTLLTLCEQMCITYYFAYLKQAVASIKRGIINLVRSKFLLSQIEDSITSFTPTSSIQGNLMLGSTSSIFGLNSRNESLPDQNNHTKGNIEPAACQTAGSISSPFINMLLPDGPLSLGLDLSKLAIYDITPQTIATYLLLQLTDSTQRQVSENDVELISIQQPASSLDISGITLDSRSSDNNLPIFYDNNGIFIECSSSLSSSSFSSSTTTAQHRFIELASMPCDPSVPFLGSTQFDSTPTLKRYPSLVHLNYSNNSTTRTSFHVRNKAPNHITHTTTNNSTTGPPSSRNNHDKYILHHSIEINLRDTKNDIYNDNTNILDSIDDHPQLIVIGGILNLDPCLVLQWLVIAFDLYLDQTTTQSLAIIENSILSAQTAILYDAQLPPTSPLHHVITSTGSDRYQELSPGNILVLTTIQWFLDQFVPSSYSQPQSPSSKQQITLPSSASPLSLSSTTSTISPTPTIISLRTDGDKEHTSPSLIGPLTPQYNSTFIDWSLCKLSQSTHNIPSYNNTTQYPLSSSLSSGSSLNSAYNDAFGSMFDSFDSNFGNYDNNNTIHNNTTVNNSHASIKSLHITENVGDTIDNSDYSQVFKVKERIPIIHEDNILIRLTSALKSMSSSPLFDSFGLDETVSLPSETVPEVDLEVPSVEDIIAMEDILIIMYLSQFGLAHTNMGPPCLVDALPALVQPSQAVPDSASLIEVPPVSQTLPSSLPLLATAGNNGHNNGHNGHNNGHNGRNNGHNGHNNGHNGRNNGHNGHIMSPTTPDRAPLVSSFLRPDSWASFGSNITTIPLHDMFSLDNHNRSNPQPNTPSSPFENSPSFRTSINDHHDNISMISGITLGSRISFNPHAKPSPLSSHTSMIPSLVNDPNSRQSALFPQKRSHKRQSSLTNPFAPRLELSPFSDLVQYPYAFDCENSPLSVDSLEFKSQYGASLHGRAQTQINDRNHKPKSKGNRAIDISRVFLFQTPEICDTLPFHQRDPTAKDILQSPFPLYRPSCLSYQFGAFAWSPTPFHFNNEGVALFQNAATSRDQGSPPEPTHDDNDDNDDDDDDGDVYSDDDDCTDIKVPNATSPVTLTLSNKVKKELKPSCGTIGYQYKIMCATWNVGNTQPGSAEELASWLQPGADIYVIGTQENRFSVNTKPVPQTTKNLPTSPHPTHPTSPAPPSVPSNRSPLDKPIINKPNRPNRPSGRNSISKQRELRVYQKLRNDLRGLNLTSKSTILEGLEPEYDTNDSQMVTPKQNSLVSPLFLRSPAQVRQRSLLRGSTNSPISKVDNDGHTLSCVSHRHQSSSISSYEAFKVHLGHQGDLGSNSSQASFHHEKSISSPLKDRSLSGIRSIGSMSSLQHVRSFGYALPSEDDNEGGQLATDDRNNRDHTSPFKTSVQHSRYITRPPSPVNPEHLLSQQKYPLLLSQDSILDIEDNSEVDCNFSRDLSNPTLTPWRPSPLFIRPQLLSSKSPISTNRQITSRSPLLRSMASSIGSSNEYSITDDTFLTYSSSCFSTTSGSYDRHSYDPITLLSLIHQPEQLSIDTVSTPPKSLNSTPLKIPIVASNQASEVTTTFSQNDDMSCDIALDIDAGRKPNLSISITPRSPISPSAEADQDVTLGQDVKPGGFKSRFKRLSLFFRKDSKSDEPSSPQPTEKLSPVQQMLAPKTPSKPQSPASPVPPLVPPRPTASPRASSPVTHLQLESAVSKTIHPIFLTGSEGSSDMSSPGLARSAAQSPSNGPTSIQASSPRRPHLRPAPVVTPRQQTAPQRQGNEHGLSLAITPQPPSLQPPEMLFSDLISRPIRPPRPNKPVLLDVVGNLDPSNHVAQRPEPINLPSQPSSRRDSTHSTASITTRLIHKTLRYKRSRRAFSSTVKRIHRKALYSTSGLELPQKASSSISDYLEAAVNLPYNAYLARLSQYKAEKLAKLEEEYRRRENPSARSSAHIFTPNIPVPHPITPGMNSKQFSSSFHQYNALSTPRDQSAAAPLHQLHGSPLDIAQPLPSLPFTRLALAANSGPSFNVILDSREPLTERASMGPGLLASSAGLKDRVVRTTMQSRAQNGDIPLTSLVFGEAHIFAPVNESAAQQKEQQLQQLTLDQAHNRQQQYLLHAERQLLQQQQESQHHITTGININHIDNHLISSPSTFYPTYPLLVSSSQLDSDNMLPPDLAGAPPPHYTCLRSLDLFQTSIIVFVRTDLLHIVDIISPSVDKVTCGVGNVIRNKGGVSIGLDIAGTQYLFINSHLAAHAHKFKDRDRDYNRIANELKYKMSHTQHLSPFQYFHHVVWIGDLNYRLVAPMDIQHTQKNSKTNNSRQGIVTSPKGAAKTIINNEQPKIQQQSSNDNESNKRLSVPNNNSSSNSSNNNTTTISLSQLTNHYQVSSGGGALQIVPEGIPIPTTYALEDANVPYTKCKWVPVPSPDETVVESRAGFDWILSLVKQGKWEQLYKYDQLYIRMKNNLCFPGFIDVRPRFPPTFKVAQQTPYITYKDQRTPSWCDRVLYRSLPGSHQYFSPLSITTSPYVTSSDHKPVAAMFSASLPFDRVYSGHEDVFKSLSIVMKRIEVCVTLPGLIGNSTSQQPIVLPYLSLSFLGGVLAASHINQEWNTLKSESRSISSCSCLDNMSHNHPLSSPSSPYSPLHNSPSMDFLRNGVSYQDATLDPLRHPKRNSSPLENSPQVNSCTTSRSYPSVSISTPLGHTHTEDSKPNKLDNTITAAWIESQIPILPLSLTQPGRLKHEHIFIKLEMSGQKHPCAGVISWNTLGPLLDDVFFDFLSIPTAQSTAIPGSEGSYQNHHHNHVELSKNLSTASADISHDINNTISTPYIHKRGSIAALPKSVSSPGPHTGVTLDHNKVNKCTPSLDRVSPDISTTIDLVSPTGATIGKATIQFNLVAEMGEQISYSRLVGFE